jgi:hypothetical protein
MSAIEERGNPAGVIGNPDNHGRRRAAADSWPDQVNRPQWHSATTVKTEPVARMGGGGSCKALGLSGDKIDGAFEPAASAVKQFRTEFILDQLLVFARLGLHKGSKLDRRHWTDFGTRSR